METFTTVLECDLGETHVLRTDDDYRRMMAFVRENADPELALVAWDDVFMRVRARETAKWLRGRDVKVTEREITSYLERVFNAKPVRGPRGMIRVWRLDGGEVATGTVAERAKPKKQPSHSAVGKLPDEIKKMIADAQLVEDEKKRPIVWGKGEYAYIRVRPLLAWGWENGYPTRYGERAVTEFLVRYIGGVKVRTSHGFAVKVGQKRLELDAVEKREAEKRVTLSV